MSLKETLHPTPWGGPCHSVQCLQSDFKSPHSLNRSDTVQSSKFKSLLRLEAVSYLWVLPCQIKTASYIFPEQRSPSRREKLEDNKKSWDQGKTELSESGSEACLCSPASRAHRVLIWDKTSEHSPSLRPWRLQHLWLLSWADSSRCWPELLHSSSSPPFQWIHINYL